MANFEIPKSRTAQTKPEGLLLGAEIIAIEQAERYNTDMVIMENGKIVYISPKEARRLYEERHGKASAR